MAEVVSTAAAYAISHSNAMRCAAPTWPTLCGMDRVAFLAKLLEARSLKSSTAAALIDRPTDQGTISKFLAGRVKDPRGEWAKRLPKALGFDPAALRDDEVATKEALRLGIVEDAPAPTVKLAREARQNRIDPGILALQIADLMRGYSQSQRETASALFQGAARQPDEAVAIAAALRALLSKRQVANG